MINSMRFKTGICILKPFFDRIQAPDVRCRYVKTNTAISRPFPPVDNRQMPRLVSFGAIDGVNVKNVEMIRTDRFALL